MCSGIVVFHTSMVNWRRGGSSALSICAFCYMLNIFIVVVVHISMVIWRRPSEVLVYVHSVYVKLLWWSSIHLWLIGGGTSAQYMAFWTYSV